MSYDPDERFSLDMDPEDALRRLLGAESESPDNSDGESVSEDDAEA